MTALAHSTVGAAARKPASRLAQIDVRDTRTCTASRLAARVFRLRPSRRLMALLAAWEGGPMRSRTAREVLLQRYGVYVGAYSYGPCVVPEALPPGTVVGRYVSMATGVRVFRRNHPMERLSLHPYFYSASLGRVEQDTIDSRGLVIGHDAWLGHGAIVTPGCQSIGIGAVVGAGAVVTKDVPDFAVVVGNPARVLRSRFDEAVCDVVRQSRWWERSIDELAGDAIVMTESLSLARVMNSPLLAACAPAEGGL